MIITAEQESWAREFARRAMDASELKAYNRRNGTCHPSVAELLEREPAEDVFKFYRDTWVTERGK